MGEECSFWLTPAAQSSYLMRFLKSSADIDIRCLIYRMRSEVRPRHLAEFGLNIRMQPWLLVRGSRKTLPWAAKQFDHLEKRKRDD